MKHVFLSLAIVLSVAPTKAQDSIDCVSPSAYREVPVSWKPAGNVIADLAATDVLVAAPGTGILVNTSNERAHGTDLYTKFEHRDADVEFDYMLAKGANSGVYLQGRYEVQLFDSWGKVNVASSDNGAIYERWNESKPDGQKGYEGYAPRQNVSRAPGTWQHMRISFQAPRFDNSGRKIENAKILKVELNGVIVQENVELFGPTRGANGNEQATGPLRIQGDHGSVAFRNFVLKSFGRPRPELTNVEYKVYKGIYEKEPDYGHVAPGAAGNLPAITANINNLPDTFLMYYSARLKVQERGTYRFDVSTRGGEGILRINNKSVASMRDEGKEATVTLDAGEYPFELIYTKIQDWGKPSLTVKVSGPGLREYLITDAEDLNVDVSDPILVDPSTNTLLRSFIDIPGRRIIHAVSIGSPQGVHYTYDMDRAAIVQVWRGGFLDATPMWHERGDGSSRPTGTVQLLGDPEPPLCLLNSKNEPWKKDTIGSQFKVKGYKLNADGRPVFRYFQYGAEITDAVDVEQNNTGVRREISINRPTSNLYVRLARDSHVKALKDGLYLIGDNAYYIKVNDTGGSEPVIRDSDGKKELVLPFQSKISYSILF